MCTKTFVFYVAYIAAVQVVALRQKSTLNGTCIKVLVLNHLVNGCHNVADGPDISFHG